MQQRNTHSMKLHRFSGAHHCLRSTKLTALTFSLLQASQFSAGDDVSCRSFVRRTRLVEPLVRVGRRLITTSGGGIEKTMPQYKAMGLVKVALESFVRIWRKYSRHGASASMRYLMTTSAASCIHGSSCCRGGGVCTALKSTILSSEEE